MYLSLSPNRWAKSSYHHSNQQLLRTQLYLTTGLLAHGSVGCGVGAPRVYQGLWIPSSTGFGILRTNTVGHQPDWDWGKTNHDCFGEFHLVHVKFEWSMFYSWSELNSFYTHTMSYHIFQFNEENRNRSISFFDILFIYYTWSLLPPSWNYGGYQTILLSYKVVLWHRTSLG